MVYCKVGATDDKLHEFLDYACNRIYCRPILPGGKCYIPNTLRFHTSYALNLYYRDVSVCPSDVSIVIHDPCKYSFFFCPDYRKKKTKDYNIRINLI